ncbi:PRD class homeobox transcription factor PRD50 [Phytophthora cinnamomi]|uniref:PRD class homeobox transcription factor PRD50 n=1 Tax=Phytophthora cinnamomi TaxID=4785 RepID=UPI00355AAFF2|nr:PRD class homeobox transcription factor PRD50 [Phytophthora cinnamomi]
MLARTLFLALLAASPALGEHNTLCDDGEPLAVSCDVTLPDVAPGLVNYVMCGSNDVLFALQAGCYLCVDATTCAGLGVPVTMDAAAQANANALVLPKANGNDISVLLTDQADHSPDEAAYEQVAAVANANLAGTTIHVEDNEATDAVTRPKEVSNWLFGIPGGLLLIAIGMAINNHMPARRRGFQRLQDTNRHAPSPLFQENINPFCTSAIDEDLAIETAGHFQGDPSNSESEEAQFLPSTELEEDEVTQAESEAIKRAVLLHIKEFDEEEDDEEVEI